MVTEEQSNDPGDSVPTGDNANYRGGDMAANGVANQGPVHNAQVGGTPGGTGTQPAPPPGPDLSEPPRCEINDEELRGFYPEEASEQGVSGQRVEVRLTIEADGNITAARSANDPGYGFARAAERAARSGAIQCRARRDRAGAAIRSEFRLGITFTMD